MPRSLVCALLCLVSLVAACGAPDKPNSLLVATATPVSSLGPFELPPEGGDEGEPGPVPVASDDPSWGRRLALVTIVEFGDFQCPFCKNAALTITKLTEEYGADNLRFVWKHNPLPFHPEAKPAAVIGAALMSKAGPDAFFRYFDDVFGAPQLRPEVYASALANTGVRLSEEDLQRATAKVERDMELAQKLGAEGTPAFFINGAFVSGAQPIERFRAIIDAQLAKSRALVAEGTPRARLYAAASAQNFVPPKKKDPPPPPDDDTKVYKAVLGSSPVLGKPTALVTVVEFGDYQCPFCIKAAATLKPLLAHYGDKVRFVWKHNPLSFHDRAEPAALLALGARAQRGDSTFWRAHDLLIAQEGALSDQDLQAVAKSLGVNLATALAPAAKKKAIAAIEEDQDLADDLGATGTPAFFFNGRRVDGAQPADKFITIINEEIAKAEEMVKKGTPAEKVYDTILAGAAPFASLATLNVPLPAKLGPTRGAANAKVVIQVFSDFQCPFCKRAAPLLGQIEAAFPGQVKIVWRNRPLPFHASAGPAAEAAMEAFAQKGAAGFWKMHDELFANQTALDRKDLEQYATTVGLDMKRFRAALDAGVHKPDIDADNDAGAKAGVSGTPTFVINGYVVRGAQPFIKLRKVVKRALAEAP